MNEKLSERIANLITIKSIVTVFLTLVFCFLACKGFVSAEAFVNIYIVVISFYYGTQYEKKKQESEK